MAKVTAISSLGWAHYTLYEAIPRMAARGFTRVEIASFSSYCFHFNFGSPTPGELRGLLAEFSLEPICLNYFAGPHKAWVSEEIDEFVAQWTRKIEELNEAGIPMMTMGFGMRNERGDQEVQLANAVKAYDRIGKIAERYQVRMLLEAPHLYSIMPGPEQVLWICDRLTSSNIGVLVDSSHWGIIGYDIDEFFSRVGSRLWHIHLRDSRGPDTGDFRQELELTAGKGTVNFQQFGEALDRVGYDGDVSIEFEYRDMPFDAIEQEFDYGLRYLEDVGWELPHEVRRGVSTADESR